MGFTAGKQKPKPQKNLDEIPQGGKPFTVTGTALILKR
jgi:hypothetical protein